MGGGVFVCGAADDEAHGHGRTSSNGTTNPPCQRPTEGRPGLVEGGEGDLIVLDEDPRIDPAALARPCAVYVGGERAWVRP